MKKLLQTVKELFEKENFIFEPHELYDPIDYTLRLGGKRIRPVMLLAANQMFGGDINQVKYAAIGIETFHNFTLLHDDLMDKSPLRRGKETVYLKWNENTAILSGDTMFALAWRYFLKTPHPQLHQILNTFNETAIGVCEGQQYDMNFEQRDDVTTEEYMEMIRLKTAILLAGALKIGAQYAQAPELDCDYLYNFGIHLGLAFQLQDDLLDAFGDVAAFGKQTGKDICDNKKTYLILKALQIAPEDLKKELSQMFATKSPVSGEETDSWIESVKIPRTLEIYKQLGIKEIVEKDIYEEFQKAKLALDAINQSEERKTPLRELMNTLLGREK